MMKNLLWVTTAMLALMVTGCEGEGLQKTARMEAPEVGLMMHVPDGWGVDGSNSRLCNKGDYCTGLILDEPLEGQSLTNM